MKQYITALIPRIKAFSETLDKKELFIEVPWVIIDENSNQEKYIFKRNGDLIMSRNGQANIGKWEYIPSAKCLLIDRIADKVLLNQSFINSAVMVMKKDGPANDYFFFANELEIPDFDVYKYLKKIYYSKNNIFPVKLKDGRTLEIHFYGGYSPTWKKVTIDGDEVADGFVEKEGGTEKFKIENSIISKTLILTSYKTRNGTIAIQKGESLSPQKGDLVFQNGSIAPDGRYRLSLFSVIVVNNGVIV